MTPIELEMSGTYLLRYKQDPDRANARVWQSVLRFVGYDRDGNPLFSGRPRVGTQEFSWRQLIEIVRVADDALIYVNHDPRKPKEPRGWKYQR